MPERDVAIYALCGTEYDPDETSKTASVYINSPYSSEPIFLRTHTVIDGFNVSFAVPPIEGYEFVGWRDKNGNIVADEYSGIYLDDMNGEDCCFYGEYRKLELHIIEFRINNVVVGYQTFYDSSMVIASAPTVELADGEVFSDWMNL